MGKVVFMSKGVRLLVSGASRELPIPFDIKGQSSTPFSVKRTLPYGAVTRGPTLSDPQGSLA